MGPLPPPPVVTQELRIVDGQGRLRILVSAKSGTPVIEILKKDGKSSAVIISRIIELTGAMLGQ
jgi:hypothetical protein